jgi:hypothetical protein
MPEWPAENQKSGSGVAFSLWSTGCVSSTCPTRSSASRMNFLAIFRNGHLVGPEVASALSPRQFIGLQLIHEWEQPHER